MAAGDFTKSELLKIKLKAESMWKDSRLMADFQPEAEAARAVLANQTATMPEILNRDKDRTLVVTWINACGIVAEDCETNCGLDENELESGSKEYVPDICKKAGFSVDAEKSRTNAYEVTEIAARGQLMAIKAMDEYWARQAIIKMKSFAGVNVAPAPWTYDNVDKSTDVPTADWNVKMIANLLQQARLNKMGSPYFVDNGSLYLEWMNAQLDGGNLDGKGDAERIRQIKLFIDQFNFGAAGVAEDLFMISPGAMGIFTKLRNSDTMEYVAGKINQWRYTVPSLVLPGVRYDAYQELTCKTVNGKSHDVYTWRFETNGLIALNPEGCPVTVSIEGVPTVLSPTGVLSYTKV
jgi:hypothetical protein